MSFDDKIKVGIGHIEGIPTMLVKINIVSIACRILTPFYYDLETFRKIFDLKSALIPF